MHGEAPSAAVAEGEELRRVTPGAPHIGALCISAFWCTSDKVNGSKHTIMVSSFLQLCLFHFVSFWVFHTFGFQSRHNEQMNARRSTQSHHNKSKGRSGQVLRSNAAPTNLVTDYQTFCAFKRSCAGLLSSAAMDEIWHTVRSVSCHEHLSFEEMYMLAVSMTQDAATSRAPPSHSSGSASTRTHSEPLDVKDVLQSLPPAPPPSSSPPPPEAISSSSSSPFDQFVAIFAGLIDLNKLHSIWSELDCSLPVEDRQELASVYAMDLLQSRSQPRRRNIRPNKQKQKKKKSSSMSSQEAAHYMISLIFEAEAVTATTISLALADHQMDVEAAVQHICNLVLKKGCFIRPDMSFAAALVAPTASALGMTSAPQRTPEEENEGEVALSGVMVNSNGTVRPLPRRWEDAEEELAPSSALLPISPAVLASDAYRLGMHFLTIFRRNNPHITAQLDSHCEFVFLGTQRGFSRAADADMHILSVAIDLHGLHVMHSIQLVDSCLEYYQYSSREQLRLPPLTKQVLLTFIVGKGLHSAGGMARIGPAVTKHLQQRGEDNFVPYAGHISVYVRIQ